MGTDEETEDSQASKTKQARIRDNQRRSRARRQEHVQSLEKRLSECHLICREAELQRDAFRELQAENACLRQLLHLAGVSPGIVRSFVQQDTVSEPSHNSALRQIKPKLAIPSTSQEDTSSATALTLASPTQVPLVASFDAYPASRGCPATSSCCGDIKSDAIGPLSSRPGVDMSGFSLLSPFESHSSVTLTGGGSYLSSGLYNDNTFCCMIFGVQATGPLQPSEGNTVLCSLAKEMIDQYNIDGEDLEEIRTRLAVGFAPPACPGEGCRVNNQLLFSVLNEISSRLS